MKKETIQSLLMEETFLEHEIDCLLKDIEVFDKILSKQKSNRQFDKSIELTENIIKTQHIIIKKLCKYADQLQEHKDIQLKIISTLSDYNQNQKGE